MDSPEISRTIRVRCDEREEAHIRSFTKWINSKLSKAQPKVKISDLFEDLRDGHALLSLLEILRHEKLRREKGKLRVHHVSNIETGLKTLEKDNIKLHGISGQAIADGVHKSTLGLVWSVILHYQVHGAMQEVEDEVDAPPQATTNAAPTRKKSKPHTEAAVEDKLLRWVQNATEGYDDVVQVNDLSKSWRDGRAFNLLIHVHRADLIKLDQMERMNNKERLENAFSVAEEHLHVQKLLEPSDVDQENPDKKLVMMYVSSLYESLRQYEPAKRRKVVEEDLTATASANVESSLPSEVFLKFKDDLSQTSDKVQKIENSLAKIEDTFQDRIDVQLWENYESEFQAVKLEINKINEEGMEATNDPTVQPFELEEIRSDMKAIDLRWSSLNDNTEKQRNRIISFQEKEEKQLNEWRKQAEIFLDWMDKMDEQCSEIEKMKSEEDLNELDRQAQILKDLLDAINTDPVTRKVLEFGRGLVMSNILSAINQVKLKEQIIEMEKELETLKGRVRQDIDRFNGNIDILKRAQSDKMGKWRKEAEAMCDWLDSMEDQLDSLDTQDVNTDIKDIYRHLEDCEKLHETIKNDARPHSIVEYGEIMMAERTLSKEQKLKIEKQLTEIKNEWKSLISKSAEVKTRLSTIRDESELEEKHKVEEWIRKFERLLKQMTKVKGTIGKLASLSIVHERNRAFQECIKVVESIKPEYQNAVECAAEVLTHDACPDWEKSQVKEDVELLKTTWSGVLDAMDEESKSIDSIMSAASDEQLEKVKEWREKYKEVDNWYQTMTPKVEGNFNMGKTLPAVQKQIAEQEEISNEMVMTHASVEYLLVNGQDLLQNVNTPEVEKNKLRKDIANLVERWESLSNTVNNRMQRLVEMAKHFEENLAGKLDEFSNQAAFIEVWLTKEEKKFQAMGGIAPNLEVAMKQKPRVEALMKEMKQEEKKMTTVLRLGEEILADSSLSEEDNNKLQQQLNTLKNRWEALDEKINWRIQRLNETISRLGSQQQDKLEKWRENAVQISDWLDKAQLRLAERGAIGSDLKAVSAQKDDFQVFLDESLEFQRHIYGFTEFGENLRTDPCINEEERSKVQQKTKSLNERWDVIVQQINNHHNALESRVDELEARHQNDKLTEWKAKCEPLQRWLTAKAIEAKSLKEIATDILTVQRYLGETKVLKSRIDNYGKQFRDADVFSKEIQKDPLIEDEKAKQIEDQAHDMINRWSALKYDLEGRIDRLSKREKELQKEGSNKVSEWGIKAAEWKEWLKSKETELENQGPVGTEPAVVKQQKLELESLVDAVKTHKESLDELMILADEVLNMKSLSDEDRRQIQQDKLNIKRRWDTLQDNLEWKSKRLSNKATNLEDERTAKIKEWKNKVTPLQEWLKKEETKCTQYQTTPDNYENLTVVMNQLQTLVETIEQKQKQLNIILRLSEDVLQSSSLSDEDKKTVQDDTEMLQKSFESLSEQTKNNLERLGQAKNELEGDKKAKIEEWKKETIPVEQWLVEENNKFDAQALSPGARLDVVRKKRKENEVLFNEMLANENRLNSIIKLHEEMQQYQTLSVEDKRKLQQEMNKIKTTWKILEEKMEAAVKRITNKEGDLEKEREFRCKEWKTKREAMEKWFDDREHKLQDSGKFDHNLDGVRKELMLMKESMGELHVQQKEFRILLRYGDEIQAHPSMLEEDSVSVGNQVTLLKTRWKELEEKMNDGLKKLNEVEKKLLEERSNDMTEWKEVSSPVKEWISKHDKKIRAHGLIKTNHDAVVKQREDIEELDVALKARRNSLDNLDSVYERLQERDSLSEDDKKKLQQELNNIKNNWQNLEELINETHTKISKQQNSFDEERLVKLEEWQTKSAPLEQLFSDQGTRWEDDDDLESNDLETLRKYKQATQMDAQAIQKQQVELQNAIRLGDEVQKHTALRDEDRTKIRMHVSSLKNQWQSLDERMHKKVKRLSSKEIAFNEERSVLFSNWKGAVSDLQDWLTKQEKKLAAQGDIASNLEAIRKQKITLETHLQEIQLKEKQLEAIVEMGKNTKSHASMSEESRNTIQQDITLLENSFNAVVKKIEDRLKRVNANEKAFQDEKDTKLLEWRNRLTSVEDFLAEKKEKLDDSGDGDLETIAKLRREMEDVAKDMELQEKKQLASVVRFGDDLKTHSTLATEDRRQIQEDIETLKENWENLTEKINWKIKRLSEKEAELKEQGTVKLQEWNKALTLLQEWFVKSEQKLESLENLESNMNNLKMQNQEYLSLQKELELQKKRVRNVAVFGEETAAHPSVSQEQRKNIKQSIVTINNEWERLNEKVNWRLASLEEKENALDQERKAKLKEWSVKMESLQGMLQEQENAFKQREGIATDLETVKFKKSEIEDMLKELELEQKKELKIIIQFSEDVFSDPAISAEDNRKIKQDIGNLTNSIENLEEKMKWRAKRLSEKEKELEEFRLGKLTEWKGVCSNLERWLSQQDLKLQSFDELSSDLDVLRQQKIEIEELVKDMDSEKNELKTVVQMGDQLLEHPSLLEEDRKLIEQQLLNVQNNWDTLVTKIDERRGRITAKETELDIEATRVSIEWRNKVIPLKEWIDVVITTVQEDSHTLDMDSLKKTRAEIESVSLELQKKDDELRNVVSFSYKLQENSLISLSQKKKIEEDSTNLKENWDELETAIEERAKSLNQNIRSCEEERDSKLSNWRESCKPLSDWLDQADLVLHSCEVSGSDLESTRKQRDEMKALSEEATSMKPKFVKIKEKGEVLKQEACLSEEERREVGEEVEELGVRLSLVVENCQANTTQFDEMVKGLENEYQDARLEEWNRVSEPIEQWLHSQEQALQSSQDSPEDLNSLYKQQETTEALALEVSAYQTQIENTFSLNEELSADPLIQDQITDVTSLKMKSIKNRWRNLGEMVQAKSESLSMKLTTLLNERQRRLAKWNDKVLPIAEWLSEKEALLSSLSLSDSLDHDTARTLKNEIVDLVVDLDSQREALKEISDDELHILQHPSIPHDEYTKLEKDLKNLQATTDNLSDKAQHSANILKEKVKSFEIEQKRKLAARQKELDEFNKTLKDAEAVITEKTIVGADISTVKKQKEIFQGVLEHCITFQDRIYNFTNVSNDLQNDPCISGDEKASIASTTDTLNERWDLVLAQLKTRNKALEEQLEELEDKHRAELLSRWQEKYEPFLNWLINTENSIKSLKDIGDKALIVRRQQEETQILITQVGSKEPDFNDVIAIAQTVNDDPIIEDSEAKTVEQQASNLSARWVVVNETLNGRSESLRIRCAFLGEQEQHLLHEWRRNIQPFNNWLSKVEDDGAYEVNGNVGVNTIKDYSVRCKTLEREVEGRKQVFEEIEKLGAKLLADAAVRDEEKEHIQEELEILQERWKKLHVKIHDNNKWADIKLIELAKKERETLDVWRKNVEPFSAWLDETNGKLDDIQKNSDTETLEQRHVALQRIKEDVVRHEEALTRIVTIVGKLTVDENVSETEKNNIKAEMNRLQEKWNYTQNNVNLNYLSITEALMELAQKEKATLEKWKKQTDPFREWIVEAKGRFDNLQHGDGYDAVQEQHGKLEILSREFVDHEADYGNISELKITILQDDHLSTSFKENIKDEADSLDKKWKELSDNITSHTDRVQKQMVTLDDSQRGQLERWQEEIKTLTDHQLKIENNLKSFENLALDVDGAKQQSADLKVVEQEIRANRSQVDEVSSICADISSDPNIANKEKTRIKKEAELIKERQNKQEKMSVDYQRRLEGKIRELEDLQSSKLEKWKTSSQPLHEWLDGVDDDAKEFDAIGANIVDVHSQFDELQKLFKEFKETEPDLFNVLKLGEDLSIDPHVSEEVRDTVTQDVRMLRENHDNVAELLKSQREKMKGQLLKLQQHQEKCLIDWNERKTSVDIRVKTMEKRTGQWQSAGDTMEDIQSQKDVLKVIEKDLESLQWELTAILEYGETLCRDKSIFDEEKGTIREEMDSMETAFRNSQKNVEQRKLSLNAKLDELRKARANEFLGKWEKSSSKTIKWVETCEKAMQFDIEEQQSLADVRERLDDVDDLAEKLESFLPEFNSTIKCGEDVIKEPSVESAAKEKVEDELSSLKERLRGINDNLDALTSRLEDQESSLSKKHVELSEKWHKDVEKSREWCKESQANLENMEKNGDASNYDELSERKKELQIMIEMLPQYEMKISELTETSRELAQNAKNKTESDMFINETQALQNDFNVLKQFVEITKSNYDSMVANLESAHGQQLSDWNKKGDRIERQLTNIETKWQPISFLENSNEDEITQYRTQLEGVVSDLNSLQPDYERHCSVGRQLSKDPALNSETQNAVEQKVTSYEQRWHSLHLARKLYRQLPPVAVDETIMKVEERQVESADMDAFDDLFGIDSTGGGNCQELMDWYVDYDSSLRWCSDADDNLKKRGQPGEYIIMVEKQHSEIEDLIQLLTTYEARMSKVLDNGQHLLDDAETLRLSKDDRSRLDNDLRTLKMKWNELQENAFDTERSLNEHLNKLREYQEWVEKAGALSQWLEMTDRKLDCCSELSEDLDEQDKQRIFLQKFATEKNENEESITDVFNLGKYIVTNHLVLKDKYTEINKDIDKFRNLWNTMLTKADQFCKLFGIPFSHIDMSSSDPLLLWKRKVDEVEKWIADAREKLHLKNNVRDFAVLKSLPETANEITKGIDNYCVPQLNEITSKAQDILNEKESSGQKNAEITETIARLSEKIKDLRQYTESQKVHVRNETLAFFTEKLNSSEVMVDRVLEDLKKLRSVGSEATVVRDQVDLIKESENYLQKHLSEFEESKRQIIEMEDKGYLATDGFEGTLKIKTVELEPRMAAVEKQFSDTKNRLAKGVINFHGQHKDDVKKWLRYCERKLNDINSDADEINIVYEEYCKLQELRREVIKGEQGFLNTLELNERLIAEAMLNEQQGKEYQGEMQAIAKSRNKIQRRIQEKHTRLYTTLIEGLNGMLSTSIHAFEAAHATLCETKLCEDFDTATEQMDGAKRIADGMVELEEKAQATLELSTTITTFGILILNEEDKTGVDEKIKQLREHASTMTGKSRTEFNRLLDEYLVLFKKEIEDRKTWISVSENRMSSSYLEIEDLPGFQKELNEHKEFEVELNHKNMQKMADAAERVTELERNYKVDVRNLEKRWKVLKEWSDDYSLELQRVVKEWKVLKQEQDLLVEWLDPNEEQLSKINEKINWTDEEGMKKQIADLKNIQSELEDKGVALSQSHIKGMALMKFLNDEAAASRTIDRDLSQLDRRWNTMAKDIIARIELLRNIQYKQADLKEKKQRVNTYIDETNAELDDHETKTQRLRGNISQDIENGETAREKKNRMKKEKETLQQDVADLVKSLEEKIAEFPRSQAIVDRINASSKDLEEVADEESKTVLHDELVNFNARWQVIVTRLEDYSSTDLPDASSFGCMGFVKRRLSGSTY